MKTIRNAISFTVGMSLALSVIINPLPVRSETTTMAQIYTKAKLGQIGESEKSAIDTTGNKGQTALCKSISDKNYQAYYYLKAMGADTAHPCTEDIPKSEMESFQNGYQSWLETSRVSIVAGTSTGTGLSTTTMVGIGVSLVAVAGAAAAAGGGGGGGGSGGNKESSSVSSSAKPSQSSSSSSTSSKSSSSSFSSSGYSVSSSSAYISSIYTPLPDHSLVKAQTFSSGDSRYGKGKFLPVINAAKAYEKTIPVKTENGKIVSYDTGALQEVRVVVMDTGVNADNKNINFAEEGGQVLQFDYETPSTKEHGTNVAGIIAGKWSQDPNTINGVAPNAKIVDWMIAGDGICTGGNYCKGFTNTRLQQVIQTNARIYNLSWYFSGYEGRNDLFWASTYDTVPKGKTRTNFDLTFNKEGSVFQNFLNHLADSESVLVLASGNKYNGEDTQLLSAAPLFFNGDDNKKNLKNLVIVAVGLDLKKGIISSPNDVRGRADYSNGCGVAAAYCLSAPAGNSETSMLLTTGFSSTDDPDLFAGTSAAAPVISGALAFVMGAYPYLKSQQAVEILFRSANKTIIGDDGKTNVFNQTGTWKDSLGNEYAISSTYGHGLVDLGAAIEPLGEISLPTSGGASSIGDLNAISKTAVSKTKLALPNTLGGNLTIALPENVMGLDDYNRPFAVKTNAVITQAHHSDESFRRYFKSFMKQNAHSISEGENKISFRFSSTPSEKNLLGMDLIDFQYALNDRNALLFSYRADTGARDFENTLINPFTDMKNAYSVAERFKLSKKVSFQFGTTLGKNGFYKGDTDRDEEYNRSVYAFTSEMDYKIYQDLTLRFIGGMIGEKEASLGINGAGAFGTENSRTYFTGSIVEYRPISKLALSAAYYYGKTETPAGDSLITIGDLISDGFAFDARYDISPTRIAGLRLFSPLKIKKGEAWLRLPYGRGMDSDRVYYDNIKVDLKPNAREYDIGFYYSKQTGNYDWRGEIMTRLHPDHIAHAKPDYRALWGIDWKF
ncbi:MAG: S8 family serine peptidase [Alphaproteobacteria bacterium]|nr:S8 family serine peptidase [Alphaproteobacteria bacterium]